MTSMRGFHPLGLNRPITTMLTALAIILATVLACTALGISAAASAYIAAATSILATLTDRGAFYGTGSGPHDDTPADRR